MKPLFANAILLILSLSGDFLSLRTVDHRHGKSQHFLIDCDILDDGRPVKDLHNFLTLTLCKEDTVRMDITWLHEIGFSGELAGYKQRFELPVRAFIVALNGNEVRTLVNAHEEKRQWLYFTSGASELLGNLIKDKAKRRALSKALRDHFFWDEEVVLYADYHESFYFTTNSMNGGLCMHKRIVKGKDGVERIAIAYDIHT